MGGKKEQSHVLTALLAYRVECPAFRYLVLWLELMISTIDAKCAARFRHLHLSLM